MKIENEKGFIKCSVDDMNENELVIELVEVNEKRKGYGTKLVEEVIEYAKENNYEAVTLCAYPQDESITLEDLVEFYKNIGFEIEYDDGSEVLMRYEI